MLSDKTFECPRCQGAIARENFAVRRNDYFIERYLLCDFCGYGVETTECGDGEVFTVDYLARTEPKNFQRFLDRLADARAA